MSEFATMDRCAAYAAARGALASVHRAAATWPAELASSARTRSVEVVMTIAEGIGHPHGSPARRRCLRAAIGHAIEVAAFVDVARAMGLANDALDRAHRHAGRTVALLGLFFHASGQAVGDD